MIACMRRLAWGSLLIALPMHGSGLRSPWDGTQVAVTRAAYACPAVQALPRDLVMDPYYSDAQYSVVDPVKKAAYEIAAAVPEQFGRQVTEAADAYRKRGSVEAAQCVAAMLAAAAAEHAFTGKMSSRQANYAQSWLLGGVAMAWLKVREDKPVSATEEQEISTWLGTMARQVEAFYDACAADHESDAHNNLAYWEGMSVAAAGIAANDDALFAWGVARYRDGIAQITPEGTLPLEMARGVRSLHYHLFAAAPLVMLAEMGEANHLDLYAEKTGALHRLVDRAVSGITQPEYFDHAAGVRQERIEPVQSADIGWAVPYARRFPSPAIHDALERVSDKAYWQWGGLPPP